IPWNGDLRSCGQLGNWDPDPRLPIGEDLPRSSHHFISSGPLELLIERDRHGHGYSIHRPMYQPMEQHMSAQFDRSERKNDRDRKWQERSILEEIRDRGYEPDEI